MKISQEIKLNQEGGKKIVVFSRLCDGEVLFFLFSPVLSCINAVVFVLIADDFLFGNSCEISFIPLLPSKDVICF